MAAGAVAETLSITEQELQTEMQSGKSLSDVAQAHGMTTSDFAAALTKIASDRISQALVAGTLTQTRADQLNQQLGGSMDFVLNFKLNPGQNFPCSSGGGLGDAGDGDASPSPSPSNTLAATT
jgi:plasmid maintenance system antidote protein VapI